MHTDIIDSVVRCYRDAYAIQTILFRTKLLGNRLSGDQLANRGVRYRPRARDRRLSRHPKGTCTQDDNADEPE